jgi:PAS domain S-box-containing protein
MEAQMTFPGSASPKVRFVAVAAAFAALYFVTAELTSSLADDVGIAVLWPASGVYLGVMLVASRQSWPALALGAGLGSLAAYAHAGSSLELSVAFAVPSSAEGLLGALLVERIVRGRFRLGGLHDVSALVIGSAVATALVALSAGAVAAQTFGVSFAESWLRWWSADALGMLAMAPLVVALAHSRGNRPEGAELRYCLGVIAFVGLTVWAKPAGAAAMAGGALVLPVLLWAGWRWGPRAAALGGTGVALAAVHLASGDLLGTGGVDSDIHVLQAFLAALLVSSLSFAAAVADWRREHVAATRSSRRLRVITESSPDAYVTVDSEGLITGWSARAQAMFGIEAGDVEGRSLESIAPGAGPITPTPDARELTLLARHRTGREFPAALTVKPGIDGDDGLWHVFIRDLTESERLGRELGRATEEMRRRARARDEARTELRGTARELDRANRRIDELAAALEERDADLADTQRTLRAEQQDLERMMRTHAKATAERDDSRRELDRSAREAARLQADLARATGDLSRTRAELSSAAGDLSREQAAGRALQEQLKRARAEHAQLSAELDRTRTERAQVSAELDRTRTEHAQLSDELGGTHAQRAELVDALDRTRTEAARLGHELERAGAERARLVAELDEAAGALAAAEGERLLVAEHASELIARYDERGVCLAASAGARGLLGYEPDELVGRPGADLLHPDDRARLLRARAGQAEATFRARLRTRAGDYVPVEVSFRPETGNGGRLGEVTTVARPIAERRADDHAGRVAETRFRSLFGTLPHPSALIGQDGRIRRANLALARLTGYSADQLEGTALGTLVDDQHAAVFGGRLRQVTTGQVATLRLEQQIAHASGRPIPVELQVTPLPVGDAPGEGGGHELVVHFEDLSQEERPKFAVA